MVHFVLCMKLALKINRRWIGLHKNVWQHRRAAGKLLSRWCLDGASGASRAVKVSGGSRPLVDGYLKCSHLFWLVDS